MQENAAAFRVFNWNIVCLTHWPLEDEAVIFQVYLFVDKDLRRHMTSLVHSELTHISQENATVEKNYDHNLTIDGKERLLL